MIVVIPTNRNINVSYLTSLIDEGVRFIIIDDTPGTVSINHPLFQVYNWEDRKRILGPLDDLFPRYNGACRDLGFYIAWLESENDEIIISIDDDCDVEDKNFAENVIQNLNTRKRSVIRGAGRHMNIFDLYENMAPELFPRGFPYSARFGYDSWTNEENIECEAIFNLGLWKGAYDINAVDKINGPVWRHNNACLKYDSVVIPKGVLVSACSMNMHFRRAVIPAIFQLPMHIDIMPGWQVDRYGDIWGGFILKTLIDIRNDRMTAGLPLVFHQKQNKYEKNIYQEHISHLINDEFVDFLNKSAETVTPSDYLQMMSDLHESMMIQSHTCSKLLSAYLKIMLKSMSAWIKALENK